MSFKNVPNICQVQTDDKQTMHLCRHHYAKIAHPGMLNECSV